MSNSVTKFANIGRCTKTARTIKKRTPPDHQSVLCSFIACESRLTKKTFYCGASRMFFFLFFYSLLEWRVVPFAHLYVHIQVSRDSSHPWRKMRGIHWGRLAFFVSLVVNAAQMLQVHVQKCFIRYKNFCFIISEPGLHYFSNNRKSFEEV